MEQRIYIVECNPEHGGAVMVCASTPAQAMRAVVSVRPATPIEVADRMSGGAVVLQATKVMRGRQQDDDRGDEAGGES